MKKVLSGIIALILTFSMVSCNNSESNDLQESNIQSEETTVDSVSDTAFANGETYFNDGNYAAALKQYDKVSENSPNYETAQERIKQANEEYKKQLISEAQSLIDNGEYKNAISSIENALDKFPDDTELNNKLSEFKSAYSDYILEKINEYILNDDYVSAINLVTREEQCADMSGDISDKLSECTDKYLDQVMQNVDELVKNNKYDEANQALNDALSVLPSNQTISDKMQEVENSKPTPLCDLKITNSEHFEQITVDDGAAEDSIGNVYAPGNLYKSWENCGNGLAEIYIGKKYTKLIGICATSDECDDGTGRLEIYADDKMIYSQKFNRKSTPFNIDLDITNCEWLKIQVTYVKDTGGTPVTILLSDFMLKK